MQAPQIKTPLRYRIVASLALLPLLAACGYKGPLYMPPPPPEEALTTPPSSAPAASPASQNASEAANSTDAAQTVPVVTD